MYTAATTMKKTFIPWQETRRALERPWGLKGGLALRRHKWESQAFLKGPGVESHCRERHKDMRTLLVRHRRPAHPGAHPGPRSSDEQTPPWRMGSSGPGARNVLGAQKTWWLPLAPPRGEGLAPCPAREDRDVGPAQISASLDLGFLLRTEGTEPDHLEDSRFCDPEAGNAGRLIYAREL